MALNRRTGMTLALLLAALLAGLGLWRWQQHRPPARLILAMDAAETWQGLTPLEQHGLRLILRDLLDLVWSGPVLLEEEMAQPDPGAGRVLRLRGQWHADRLTLTLLEGHATWMETGSPEQVLARVAKHYARRPIPSVDACLEGLDGPLMADLIRVAGWRSGDPLDAAAIAAKRVTERAPRSALAHLWHAHALFRHLIEESDANPELQLACERHFREAIALAPDLPNGGVLFARFLVDQGRHREAFDVLIAHLKVHPQALRLHESTAYAGRTGGLLEVAQAAIEARERLAGPSGTMRDLAENTLLYLGWWDRFQNELDRLKDPSPNTIRDFYRGYVRLLRGQREEATPFFQRAVEHPLVTPQFSTLSRVYWQALQGREQDALRTLRGLWKQRVSLRVPDGEFTFKLAEAFAFLGQRDEAMDVLTRAVSQGFCCQAWFQRTPFLEPLRGHPRWAPLMRTLGLREAQLRERFPKSRFRFS